MTDEKAAPPEIWLEPLPPSDNDIGRQWCIDNVWGKRATRYVLADDAERENAAYSKRWDGLYDRCMVEKVRAETAEATIAERTAEVERLREALTEAQDFIIGIGQIGGDWPRDIYAVSIKIDAALTAGEPKT